MSERRSGGVDALGIARMTLSSVFEGPSDMWIPLDLVSTGEVCGASMHAFVWIAHALLARCCRS